MSVLPRYYCGRADTSPAGTFARSPIAICKTPGSKVRVCKTVPSVQSHNLDGSVPVGLSQRDTIQRRTIRVWNQAIEMEQSCNLIGDSPCIGIQHPGSAGQGHPARACAVRLAPERLVEKYIACRGNEALGYR